MRSTCLRCSVKLEGDSCPECGWTRWRLDEPEAKTEQPHPEGMLRYRFPKSTSKRFQDAMEFAQGLSGYYQDGDDAHWVEIPADQQPCREFRELERISQGWKNAGHFIGDKRVTRETWWAAANPFGKLGKANVGKDWIERRLWLDWGKPENLVVGESFRQGNLRQLAGVGGEVLTLQPFPVTLERDLHNESDRNAIKAHADGIHVGYLMGDRAAVVAPAMDKAGIKEMCVAGVLSGSTDLGMHIWPDRLLTDGIVVGDPGRPVPTIFYSVPRPVHEDYLEAKRNYKAGGGLRISLGPARTEVRSATPEEKAAVDKAVGSCLTAMAWIFGVCVFFVVLVVASVL